MRSDRSGTRLGLALLAYMLAVTLIITLLPFHFAQPERLRIIFTGDLVDFIANIVLFLPFGFLFRLTMGDKTGSATGNRARSLLWVLAAGAALSACIEAAQMFQPARDASVLDVVSNAGGALLGALAFDRVSAMAEVEGRVVGWLSLELPLMTLTWLFVPLLWASSIAVGGETARLAGVLILGLAGAILLGGMQRYYFGPARVASAPQTAVAAGAWFLAGTFPLVAAKPLVFGSGAAAVALLCWCIGRWPLLVTVANRRFEIPLLRAVAPVYGSYIALLALAPLTRDVGPWRLSLGFSAETYYQLEILRVLELVAACTLVGYMVAELRGRVILRYRDALPRLVTWGLMLVLAVEAVRGFHEAQGASLARAAVLAAAVLYGGWLYYLQRAHVVQLLAAHQAPVLGHALSGRYTPPQNAV
jgi:VanZ family protein